MEGLGQETETAASDLDAAEVFLKEARAALQRGDHVGFMAARKLVMVALGVGDVPPARNLRTSHLRSSQKTSGEL